MFNGVKKVIQLITESDTLIYSKNPDTLTQSCTRIQISRSDHTRPTKFVTRPANIPSFLDPTRPDDYPWWAKKALCIARHDAHCPAIAPMWPAARESAPTLRTYQIHVPSVRMHRDLHEVAALYQLLPESLNCDDWVPTTCTLETSVMWLSSYLLWFVHGLEIKSRYVKQQLLELYKYG